MAGIGAASDGAGRVPGGGARAFDRAVNLPSGLATVALVAFPLILVLFLAVRFNAGGILGRGFTFSNLATALGDPLYRLVLLRSLVIAAAVTIATVVTAYPVAYAIAVHGGRHRRLLLFLVTLPFWTSYLLRVFAWKIVLAYNGVLNSALLGLGVLEQPLALLNTPATLVVTLAHAYAAFAILPIYVALEGLPRSLTEAAADLGARPGEAFRRVVLPLSMPGVLAAALVVFVPTVGDYVTPALVGGPASTMIGQVIQSQFGKAADWPFGASLAVVTMAATAVVVVLARAADRRFGSRS